MKYEAGWCIIKGLSGIGFRRDAKFEFEGNTSGIELPRGRWRRSLQPCRIGGVLRQSIGSWPGQASAGRIIRCLAGINGPADLKKLSVAQLSQLADEIRQFIIETVGRTGGHLASSLGVVEITLALHYVFDFEQDKLSGMSGISAMRIR